MHPDAALEDLFWEDEVLRLLYWLEGEGLGQDFGRADLEVFLSPPDGVLEAGLCRLADRGWIAAPAPGRFHLTSAGRAEAARRFQAEFAGLTGQAHGECGPDCDCHQQGADACWAGLHGGGGQVHG